MISKEELERLVEESKEALSRLAGYTTAYNQNMLRYMIGQAEMVLRGGTILPVSGSRAFSDIDENASMEFVYSHHVMFGFEKDVGGDEYFGLKQALDWFVRSDSRGKEERCDHEEKKSDKEYDFFFERNKKDYLIFSNEEWENIKERIRHNEKTRGQYKKIQEIADRMSLEKICALWKATWESGAKPRNEDELYSDTAKGITFQAPQGAASARLRLVFPKTSHGIQQEWKVRNIRVVSADAKEWMIQENVALELGNEASIWESKETFPVKQGNMYTLHFQVNQRQKLSQGIQVEVCYKNEQGEQDGKFIREYNRKAWYPVISYNLDMQCNAICYAVTGDEIYARKAMYQMILFLDDFCQGAAYWMRYNCRPEGRDNYGAVQAGRNLCSVAMTYVFIKDAPVWEERKRFYRLAEFVLNDVLDLRDRTCLTPWRVQEGTGNWQTDMCIGAAMLAAALEEIPYRKQWIQNAEAVLSAQLSCNLNPDGSWPESLRYHHAVLEHFCIFARFWEHETGEDWFFAHHLDRMFAYSIGTQLPPYTYFQDRVSTPPFGDHKLGDGGEYQILGQWIKKVAQRDSGLAAQMQETWERAGCPVREPGGESVAAEMLLIYDTGKMLGTCSTDYRTESRAFQDAGLYLFRQKEKGICLAVMCSGKKIGHGHLDQGSFMYYYRNIPLVMDSGIEGYFDATAQWHISSVSHACMLFQTKQECCAEGNNINLTAGNFARRLGWCDTPETANILEYKMGEGTGYIRMRIDNAEGEGFQIRSIIMEENDVLVQDEVVGFQGEILFCLPMLVRQAGVTQENNLVLVKGNGYYGVDLEVESMGPIKKAWLDWGRVTPMYPGEGIWKIPFLRMRADARDGFLVRIAPRE